MFLSKTIQRHVNIFKQDLRLYTHGNPSKIATRKYSSQEVQSAIPKFKKPSLRTPKVGRDIDGMSLFLLCIPISTFCLGVWQIKRKKWKEDLIEELLLKTKSPAVALPPSDVENLKDMEFRRVQVKGRFDHSGEIYLGPRSCLVDGESKYAGKLISTESNNSVGYYVITPFELSDTKERILVNRGWIPFPQKNPKTRPQGQVEGEVEIEGIIRTTEPRQAFAPDDRVNVRVFITRNVEKMADLLETKPIFIDATVESTVPGGPIGGQTRASLRNEHLSYILTWFSLSAATSVMWYAKYIL